MQRCVLALVKGASLKGTGINYPAFKKNPYNIKKTTEYKMSGAEMCGFAGVSKVGLGLPVYLKQHKLQILTAAKIAFAMSSMLQCVIQPICF